MTSSRTPEYPRARLAALSSRTSRTTRAGSGSPTPTACERSSLSCSSARSSRAMRCVASLPKPVLTPYTGASPAVARRTVSALARTATRQAGARATCRSAVSTSRRSCASVSSPGVRSSGFVTSALPTAGSPHHRQVQALLPRTLHRDLIARVPMPHHPGGGIVPQHAPDLLVGLLGAVAHHHHARMLRITDADAAAVVEAHP